LSACLGVPMTLESHTEYLSIETPEGARKIAFQSWQRTGGGDAPLLICVHGLTRNRHDFDFIAHSMTACYRVVTVDIIGRGDSDRLQNPEHYGYPLYVSQMMQLLKHLASVTGETRCDWLGTSMGGLIGMMIAATPGSPIDRLILNDIGPEIPLAGLQRLSEYVGKAPPFFSFQEVEAYQRVVASGFGDLTDEQWNHMARYAATLESDGFYRMNYDPAIALAFEGLNEDIDLTPVWQAVSCPVLVLRGEDSDLLTAECAERMAEKRDVRLVSFPGTGHAPALFSEEQIAAVRDFLVM